MIMIMIIIMNVMMEGDEYQIIVLTVNSLPIYRFYNPSNK